ncbi:unnamed protein product [Phytophthora lilii]|uniref:Unnamed protein product n=1 Tax=Phytophthora lilii TaxID=2077276 RepID=A0A9W6UA64_9STRA|nr:unnamed protein product [Phytophthora lilii]
MVPNKSALTSRLNRLTSKNVPFIWTPEDAEAFRSIKAALARNVWLAFPDYSRTFHVFADASGRQIGDHKNLLYPQENSLRVKRWKLLLEEYRLSVKHIPGSQNIEADAFSRLRYDFVKQVTEEELLAVDDGEVPIDGSVMKRYQQEDDTCKQIIARLEKHTTDPEYSMRPALGVVLLHHRKHVLVPETLP